MIRLIVGVVVVLVIWRPLRNIAFTFAQGQDWAFDLGDSYELAGPGLHIIYWPSEERENVGPEKVIPGPVVEFALSGPWIIGRTGDEWFAVNKRTHQVHYPRTKEQLQTITGLDISSIKMETDPMPYLIVRPQALAAKASANRFCWVLLFVVPAFLGFAPYVPRALGAKGITRIGYLCAWIAVSGLAWIVCQGVTQVYNLDSNYFLEGWPGWIVKLDRLNKTRTYVLDFESAVGKFAVLDNFIIGKTYMGRWFAINRKTHKVWYPYESKKELESTAGVTFSDSQLITSFPWSRLVVHLRTTIALPLIWLFFATALIGFRRTGRGIKLACKWAQKLVKKPAVS